MKTKLISMLLAGIMLVSLAACANDNDKPGSTPEESTKETDVQTTEDVTTEEDTTEPEETGWQGPGKNPNMEECEHGPDVIFDNNTMTLSGLDEYTHIWEVLIGLNWSAYNNYHEAKFFKDGIEIRNSYVEEGMKIKVYHYGELYGEYTVTNVVKHDKNEELNLPNRYITWPDTSTMGVAKNTTIEDFFAESEFRPYTYGDGSKEEWQVLKNGEKVTTGNFEDGMIVKHIFKEDNDHVERDYEVYIAEYMVPRR